MVAEGEEPATVAGLDGVEMLAAFDVKAVHDTRDELRGGDDRTADDGVIPTAPGVPPLHRTTFGLVLAGAGVTLGRDRVCDQRGVILLRRTCGFFRRGKKSIAKAWFCANEARACRSVTELGAKLVDVSPEDADVACVRLAPNVLEDRLWLKHASCVRCEASEQLELGRCQVDLPIVDKDEMIAEINAKWTEGQEVGPWCPAVRLEMRAVGSPT